MSKIKIREIKSKVKIISHESESEGDKEIAQLTKGEPMIEESSEISRTSGFVLKESSAPRIIEQTPRAQTQVRETNEQGATGSQLYDVGRGLGNEREGRRSYYSAQRAVNNAQTFQEASTFTRGQSIGSAGGITQQTVGGILDERSLERKPYETNDSDKSKKRRVGPWE